MLLNKMCFLGVCFFFCFFLFQACQVQKLHENGTTAFLEPKWVIEKAGWPSPQNWRCPINPIWGARLFLGGSTFSVFDPMHRLFWREPLFVVWLRETKLKSSLKGYPKTKTSDTHFVKGAAQNLQMFPVGFGTWPTDLGPLE